MEAPEDRSKSARRRQGTIFTIRLPLTLAIIDGWSSSRRRALHHPHPVGRSLDKPAAGAARHHFRSGEMLSLSEGLIDHRLANRLTSRSKVRSMRGLIVVETTGSGPCGRQLLNSDRDQEPWRRHGTHAWNLGQRDHGRRSRGRHRCSGDRLRKVAPRSSGALGGRSQEDPVLGNIESRQSHGLGILFLWWHGRLFLLRPDEDRKPRSQSATSLKHDRIVFVQQQLGGVRLCSSLASSGR